MLSKLGRVADLVIACVQRAMWRLYAASAAVHCNMHSLRPVF